MGPLDGLEDAGDRLRVVRDAAERIRCGDCRVALFLQAADHVVPTGGLGEGAVHEDDGGPGSILRVRAHRVASLVLAFSTVIAIALLSFGSGLLAG